MDKTTITAFRDLALEHFPDDVRSQVHNNAEIGKRFFGLTRDNALVTAAVMREADTAVHKLAYELVIRTISHPEGVIEYGHERTAAEITADAQALAESKEEQIKIEGEIIEAARRLCLMAGQLEPAWLVAQADKNRQSAATLDDSATDKGAAPSVDPWIELAHEYAADGLDDDTELAALFDGVRTEELNRMFPGAGDWKKLAERAHRTGLKDAAKVGRALFNPMLAALWWLNAQNPPGWDTARVYRTLANNLPPRSRHLGHLLTGDYD